MAGFGQQSPEFAMLFFIKMDAKIRLAGPIQLDRQHILVARVWRHEKPALVAQNILAGLNILGFADDWRLGGAAQPPSQRQREIMVGVDEVDPLRLQSARKRRQLGEFDQPSRLIAVDQWPPAVF